MSSAFILINAQTGCENSVLNDLNTPSVGEVHLIFGVYDIIAKVNVESSAQLKEIISRKIRRLDKVQSTLTLIVKEG